MGNKICPYCGEEIKTIAIKCKHCGSMLTDSPPSNPSLTGIHLVNHALGDRYEILEEIGRGGMATVYKAIQKSLKRPVALKVVHQNLLHDTEFVARFHREAQLCASLNHPNIVTVHDEGEVSGVHFMAMEYLEGTDLHRLIRSRGRLTPEQTLQYLLPVAEALDYAHGKGYIHRDIKSANIFITGSGRVVLMDFGIAHAAAGTQLTRAGTVIGTPEYMSPEQAEGKKVDHRTDLYSLGVVMYECLAGRVPFKGDSAITTIYKLLHEQPDLNELDHTPNNLKTFIQKLLSKNADQRPATTTEVIAQIQQIKTQGHQLNPSTGNQGFTKSPDPKVLYHQHIPNDRYSEASAENVSQHDYDGTIKIPRKDTIGAEKRLPAITIEPIGLEMVYVEGGEFIMGCTGEQGDDCYADERPAHRVSLSGFYIGKYPVTQGQWSQVMGNNPSRFMGSTDYPIERISWNDAKIFLRKLNQITGKKYNLPTEAQWEYAARGGQQSQNYKYSGSDNIDEVAWNNGNSGSQPKPVGRKNPNELGIYDMCGNLLEWCEDDWHTSYFDAPDNGIAYVKSPRCLSRVLRGGSWRDTARDCRVSARHDSLPGHYSSNIGFRLYLSVD